MPSKKGLHLTDVTLRDGLQVVGKTIATDDKLTLFKKLIPCGYERLEVTSFVSPKWVPQFADAEAFCEALFAEKLPVPELMAFIPNAKGMDRLLPFPIPWVSCFVAASETFNRKNVNASIDETIASLREIKKRVRAEKRKLRVYISTVFGCPYEKSLPEAHVRKVLGKVFDLAPDEVALSDTIGVAAGERAWRILDFAGSRFSKARLALHVHNTYGSALVTIEQAIQLGIKRFDGSTGGVGGCPFAKGATGNVATELIAHYAFRRGDRELLKEKEIQDVVSFLTNQLSIPLSSPIVDIWKRGGSLYQP